MTISKTRFEFYRENKLNSFAGYSCPKTITIHKVINSKTCYDPFEMRKKGTRRNNSINLLRSCYKAYAQGRQTKLELKADLFRNKYLKKYINRFE